MRVGQVPRLRGATDALAAPERQANMWGVL